MGLTRVIGNPRGLPWSERYIGNDVPDSWRKLRLYRADEGEPDDDYPTPWQLDECAVVNGYFLVSEWCENYPTFESACAAVRGYLADTRTMERV